MILGSLLEMVALMILVEELVTDISNITWLVSVLLSLVPTVLLDPSPPNTIFWTTIVLRCARMANVSQAISKKANHFTTSFFSLRRANSGKNHLEIKKR